jgi:MFS family permease
MKLPNNFGKVTYLAFGILCLYIAFNSSNNIESELMNHDGFEDAGFLILGVIYLSMGIGSLMSTALINKFGTRLCLFIGGIGCITRILITVIPALSKKDDNFFLNDNEVIGILIFGSLFNGITMGALIATAN